MRSMSHGVPMVLVPWGRDQEGVGYRAERLGVAKVVPRDVLSVDSVADAINAELIEPTVSLLRPDGATTAGARRASEPNPMSERSEPSLRPSPDLCTEAKLKELLDRVITGEWTTRPDEIAFGAFVDTSVCRVVVQSDFLR